MEEFLRRLASLSGTLPERILREIAPEGRSVRDGRISPVPDTVSLVLGLVNDSLRRGEETAEDVPFQDRVREIVRASRSRGIGLPECLEVVLRVRRALEVEVHNTVDRGGISRRVVDILDRLVVLLGREWGREGAEEPWEILDGARFPLFLLNGNLEVAWCNRAAQEVFGKPGTAVRSSEEPGTCPKVIPEVSVPVAAMIQSGASEAFLEREVGTRVGTRLMGIGVQRLRPGLPGNREFLVVMTDLTRRREIEEHLRKSRKMLEEKVRFRTEELEQVNRSLLRQIQERNAAEAVLRESEERYRLLVTLSPDGIVVHQKGRVVFFNEAAAAILGAEPEEAHRLLGMSVVEFVHPDHRAAVLDRIRRMSEGAVEVPPLEERFLGLHGEVVDVEVKASSMQWEGQPAVMVVFRDIRERKRARRELEERAAVTEVLLEGRERLAKASRESLPDEVAGVFGRALRIYRLYWCVPNGLQGPFRIAGRFAWFDADRAVVRDVSDVPVPLLEEMEKAVRTRKTVCLEVPGKGFPGDPNFGGDARSMLLAPVSYNEKTFGVMVACCQEENGFPENRRLVAQTAAEYIGAALENIQLTMRLREAEARYRSIFSNALEGIYAVGPDGRILAANPALARILGYRDAGEMIAAIGNFRETVHADPKQREDLVRSLRERGEIAGFPYLAQRADGRTVWVSETAWAVRDEQGRVLRWEGVIEDVHERRRMENQIQRVQKMEALGRLAGGVAHDFNNLLAAILGFAGILLEEESLDPKVRELVDEIRLAGERGAELTRRLLVFSRGQISETSEVELGGAVRGMDAFLKRLLGEEIDYRCMLPEEEIWVRLQGGTLDQVLMNLVVNARDAMPRGGSLTIGVTRRIVLPDEKIREGLVNPGEYGQIEVADTGIGMDPEVLARAFEPFFSTKDAGKGTGLGLSVVYGIVRQSGGAILVESEVGRGTRFRILLPSVSPPAAAARGGCGSRSPRPRGAPEVLVVEDEASVRGFLKTLLEHAGYRVQVAVDGRDALDIVQGEGRSPDLLVTDLVMPRMDGETLVRHMRARWPELPVICISGYSRDTGFLETVAPPIRMLQKPFHVDEVLGEIARMLGARGDVDG
ncbi:PAS domain S-box protein [Myxococcota bacterium]|nr:PAS domain S-box protein [Myxococcota bacterium]